MWDAEGSGVRVLTGGGGCNPLSEHPPPHLVGVRPTGGVVRQDPVSCWDRQPRVAFSCTTPKEQEHVGDTDSLVLSEGHPGFQQPQLFAAPERELVLELEAGLSQRRGPPGGSSAGEKLAALGW